MSYLKNRIPVKTQDQRLEELYARMQELAEWSDIEAAHAEADDVLCEALEVLGQRQLVRAFHAVDKWYA